MCSFARASARTASGRWGRRVRTAEGSAAGSGSEGNEEGMEGEDMEGGVGKEERVEREVGKGEGELEEVDFGGSRAGGAVRKARMSWVRARRGRAIFVGGFRGAGESGGDLFGGEDGLLFRGGSFFPTYPLFFDFGKKYLINTGRGKDCKLLETDLFSWCLAFQPFSGIYH